MHDDNLFIGFTDFPVSRNVTVDTVVEFNCGHPDAEAVIWTINGTQFADGQFPDLNVTSYGNRGTSHLFIVAHLMYTSTEIECTIFLPNSFTLRTAALLSIQGPLIVILDTLIKVEIVPVTKQ